MRLRELMQRIALQRKEELPYPEDIETYLEDFIPNTLLKSETLQVAFGVSPYEMEELYKEGYSFYDKGAYVDANNIFRWLVLLNPYVSKYWLGLAATQQLIGRYEKALHSYAIVGLLDQKNPYPHFHAFECYKALKQDEEAAKALQSAYCLACNQSDYADLRIEIEALMLCTT